MAAKLFYIGERLNPQLPKPYYNAYGQLTKKDADRKESCLYGSISLTGFSTKEDYENAIKKLESEGFRVNKR